MGNLLIRDVEDTIVQRLKVKAKINRTSLQHEASKALSKGTSMTGAERLAILEEARRNGKLPKVSITGAEIVREIRDEDEGEL
jgi:plasmid stability protein